MISDPFLIGWRSLTYIFNLCHYFLGKSCRALRFPISDSFFYIFVYFLCQNICFPQRNHMYSFLLACIEHYIQAFSRNVGNLGKKSCLFQILCFFKQLVDIHPVCSPDFSGNWFFVCIKNTDSHRFRCNSPPSNLYSSLLYILFFKIYLRFISFFIQCTSCNGKPNMFFVRKLLIDHKLMITLQIFRYLNSCRNLYSLHFLRIFKTFLCTFIFFHRHFQFVLIQICLHHRIFRPVSLHNILCPV